MSCFNRPNSRSLSIFKCSSVSASFFRALKSLWRRTIGLPSEILVDVLLEWSLIHLGHSSDDLPACVPWWHSRPDRVERIDIVVVANQSRRTFHWFRRERSTRRDVPSLPDCDSLHWECVVRGRCQDRWILLVRGRNSSGCFRFVRKLGILFFSSFVSKWNRKTNLIETGHEDIHCHGEFSTFEGDYAFIGWNEPMRGENEIHWRFSLSLSTCSLRFCTWESTKFDSAMASNAEFRRVVNYTDLEVLLECMYDVVFAICNALSSLLGPLCLDRFDQPRSFAFFELKKCLLSLSLGLFRYDSMWSYVLYKMFKWTMCW